MKPAWKMHTKPHSTVRRDRDGGFRAYQPSTLHQEWGDTMGEAIDRVVTRIYEDAMYVLMKKGIYWGSYTQ